MSPCSPQNRPGGDVRSRLRAALGAALRARDLVAVSALRSALSAIGNAEAVPPPPTSASRASSAYIAGAAAGLGAGEAQRRRLSEAEAAVILRAEIAERLAAAASYERAGRSDRAGRLQREAQVLASASALSRATSDRMVSMLGPMSEDVRGPAEYASHIDAARERLVAFVEGCTDEQWTAAPLEGDPRPVGVVVDHVAHSYEYLAGWMSQLLAGETVIVDTDVVDALNVDHAGRAADVTRPEAVEHLRRSGAALSRLVAGCTRADLLAGEGRVERFAQVAIRHADNHRTEIEAGLAASLRQAEDSHER